MTQFSETPPQLRATAQLHSNDGVARLEAAATLAVDRVRTADAIRELVRNAGTQLDADVVTALTRVLGDA